MCDTESESETGLCETCGRALPLAGRREAGEGWVLCLGRAEDVLETVPAGSVAAIATDPPYGSGGDTRAAKMAGTGSKYVNSSSSYQRTLPDFAGDSLPPEAWVAMMLRVWEQCARVLAPDGVFLCFTDWRQAPGMYQVLAHAGLRVRGQVGWDKGLGTRPRRGGFRQQEEYILWGGNGALPRRDIYLAGVMRCPTLSVNKIHQTQKPIELMLDVLPIVRPGGLILDPFAGSATTGVAALQLGYEFHGIEQVPAIYQTALDRLRGVV